MYDDAIKAGGYAVVTGAASGVGRVAALRFAEAGLGVILADLPGSQHDHQRPHDTKGLCNKYRHILG